MNKLILGSIFLIGSITHIYLGQLNEVLKVADSFAYLQMAEYLQGFSTQGFGTGWFGFFYSLPIAVFDFFLNNHFLSAQILNILLFNISGVLLYQIAKSYLQPIYLYLLLILFFLSPILLHFNIAILSENIYIPLFLSTVLVAQNFLKKPQITHGITFGLLIALMYLTRGEAFIYIGSVGLISLFAYWSKFKEKKVKKWFLFNITLIVSFCLFVSPYIYHLHTITGEWGLSNKGSSNLRQATLRGKEKMDDAGFEQAVAELTANKKHLIAGFAGGLKYDTPQTGLSLKSYILEDPQRFLSNWFENQKKLYSQNLPHIILGDAGTLYLNSDSQLFYKNKVFLLILTLPLLFFFIGIIQLFRSNKKDLLLILGSFFFIASIFFTLFFTLNRYFLIFLPLFLIIIVYGIQNINSIITFTWTGFAKTRVSEHTLCGKNIFKILCALTCIGIYSLGILSYYNSHKFDDERYLIKKEAGEWLKRKTFVTHPPSGTSLILREDELFPSFGKKGESQIQKLGRLESRNTDTQKNFNILERFPIVTYYSGTQYRFITPYTNSLSDLLVYAKYNNIHFLIVDSLDFKKYRPGLQFLLDEKKEFEGLENIKVFTKKFQGKKQKVIIYKIL